MTMLTANNAVVRCERTARERALALAAQSRPSPPEPRINRPSREIVGYRVRWTDPNGCRGQTAYGVGGREGYDVADCKRRAADKRKALDLRGCTFVVVTAIVRVPGERGPR